LPTVATAPGCRAPAPGNRADAGAAGPAIVDLIQQDAAGDMAVQAGISAASVILFGQLIIRINSLLT
jgi:hypothetical protein